MANAPNSPPAEPSAPSQSGKSAPSASTPTPAPAASPAAPAPQAPSSASGGSASRPPAPASGSQTVRSGPSGSKSGSGTRDARGLSALDESALEKSIIRRGLATPQELEYCKQQRARIAKERGEPPGLLQVMIAAKALTESQARRLFQEVAAENQSDKVEIPGYTDLKKIGKGSMGTVYKAKQLSVDRVVAVKVLLDQLAKNKEFITRFEREAKIAAKLSHNNVVNAIDAGVANGHYYFVMEYVEGETIKDFLEKGRIFDEKTALKIVIPVAEALKHAHQRGLIHRDIKPENVILTRDGNVKLADLGLARLTSDEKWAMAEAGMAIGTPYYISPEQVRGQVDVDIRSDIYSLGATLYHMVTGHVPYSGETPTEVMKKHVAKDSVLVPPDHLNTSLSSGLGEVVETMMAKNREERYRNPEDLLLDLKCLMAGDPPMIASQKASALEGLAEASPDEEYGGPVAGGATAAEMTEMAAYVNSRTNIIAGLAILLGLSVVTNVLFLMMR
jgi:predicted Ser/Thr protein kinase